MPLVTMSRRRAGGIIAALAVFVIALALQDVLRSDVSAIRHWISHLSLGPWAGSISLACCSRARRRLLSCARFESPHRRGGRP
ncbi:hypothetical protein Phou_077750 [Phytohabitans houttuyneae]|uniref:Uncharacterized protein n=1 Tax=Phytohabitans houttuyneae TaxID=1076126 RepID=A0A6V8KSL4_9ACTN|nr:hypothetical protein Phou_077750 [Phytohabitans houttuyneae]